MDNWLMNNYTFETYEDEPSTWNLNLKRKKVTRKYYDLEYLKIVFFFFFDRANDDPRPQCIFYEILTKESIRPNKLRRNIDTKNPDLKDWPLSYT